MASFWDPPVILEPAITWRQTVSLPRDREAWEVNQSRNPTTSGAHLARCVYCDPTSPDGSRIIKYMLDGSDVSEKLPPSTYGYSLDDVLPQEVERAPWMKLTRHPLVWDGQPRPDLTGRYFNTVGLIPSEDNGRDWRRSMEAVGLHWLPDHDRRHQPPFDIPILIRLAIMGSPNQILSKPEMEELLCAKFPWFKQHRYDPVDFTGVNLTGRRGKKRPEDVVYSWPYYIGQELDPGPLHPWLYPHPYPNRQPGSTTFWYIKEVDFKSGRRLPPPRAAAEIQAPTPGISSEGSSHGSPALVNQFEDEVSQSVYTSATPPPATPPPTTPPSRWAHIFDGDLSPPPPLRKSKKFGTTKKVGKGKQPNRALTLKEKYPIERKEQHPLLFYRLLERLRKVGTTIDEKHLETQRQRFVNAEGQEADPRDDTDADSIIGTSTISQTIQESAGNLLPRLKSAPTPIFSPSHSQPGDLRRTQSSSAVRQGFHLADLREAAFIKAIIKMASRSMSLKRSGDGVETTQREVARKSERVRRPSRQNTIWK